MYDKLTDAAYCGKKPEIALDFGVVMLYIIV